MVWLASLAAPLGLAAVGLLGCDDVTEFSTGPGESFCGSIVQGRIVRAGFGPGVRLRLNLDASRLHDAPGALSTDDGSFLEAPLLVIPHLSHDQLSTFQYGSGQVRNLIYAARPTSGSIAYVFISLIENGDVEVRVLRGASRPSSDSQVPIVAVPVDEGVPLFGVFPLTRQRGTCGF